MWHKNNYCFSSFNSTRSGKFVRKSTSCGDEKRKKQRNQKSSPCKNQWKNYCLNSECYYLVDEVTIACNCSECFGENAARSKCCESRYQVGNWRQNSQKLSTQKLTSCIFFSKSDTLWPFWTTTSHVVKLWIQILHFSRT